MVCTITADGTTVPVPLLTGSSPVTLAAGETATFSVLAGSQCRVMEQTPRGATVTFTESGEAPGGNTTDGTVTVSVTAAIVVTNTFPAVLPPTGARLGPVLFLAFVLFAAGIALVGLRRRSKRLGHTS